MKKRLLLIVSLCTIIFSSSKGLSHRSNTLPVKDDITESVIFYLSKNGAVSDADLSIGSVKFGTDNTKAIQKVLDKARENPIIVYWDGKYSVTGLKVYSNTTIIAFEGCGAILRNNSDKSLLENANLSLIENTDSNISIQGGIWNGNGYNDLLNPAQAHDKPDEGWLCVFRFFGVNNVTIKDLQIFKPRTFALHGAKVKNVFIQNVKVDVGDSAPINCDGIHFNGPAENVTVTDCVINAKDDHVAFNADSFYALNEQAHFGGNYYKVPGGPITDVTINNIKLEGGLFGIRLLSGKCLIDNVRISNIHGKTKDYWLVADNFWQRFLGPGNFGTIFIQDINVVSTEKYHKNVHRCCANINANAECITFKNIIRNSYAIDNFPSILVGGKDRVIKKLIIDGYYASEDSSETPKTTNHIEINEAKVNYLGFNNVALTRDYPANSSPLLCVKNGGSVDYLQMTKIFCKGINNIVDAQSNISHISASNIIHMDSKPEEGSFKADEMTTVSDMVLTNYSGSKPISGKGSFLKTRGDGFPQKQDNYTGKIKSVVILGNSIVQHPPKPEIGWNNDWGMAASVQDSDFVHLIIRDIHQIDPSVEIKFMNIYDFERNFDTYNLSCLDSLKNPDILIIKISENVKDKKAFDNDFISYYDKLIKYLSPNNKTVKIICDGFWPKKINNLIEEYAHKNNYSFTQLSDLSKDLTNTAKGKFEHKGVAAHPSDKGMRIIEQRIWESLKNYFK